MSSIVNAHVFREYDIRGVAERDLTDAFCRDLGRALGTLWARRGQRRVAVGRDCRLSSPRLHAALCEGILETGRRLVDVGVVPTPLVYFTVFHLDLDGGVMITGSHNPPDENGFKIMSGKQTLAGEEIRSLRDVIEAADFERAGGGDVESFDPIPAYAGYAVGNVRLGPRRPRFAVDAGSGVGGPAALAAMHALGLEPVALLCEPDGRFPVHHPDPSLPENLELLVRTVRAQGLDLGIAFDGDADRIGVVDGRGRIVFGDRLLAILARALLAERPGAAILGEVKCSQVLYDDIAAHGGRPILWKTGHSLIKRKMKEEGALLAGEMSGHVFWADRYYGYDDAIYTALRLIEVLSRSDRSLDAMLDELPATVATPEIRVPCPDDRKFDVVARVREAFRGRRRVIDIDGARVQFEDGFGLVRASNTQPVLVLRFEAPDEGRLAVIRAEIEAVLHEAMR
ncbi:MAG: phosphomannomutase/phosphoglucomutase [Myxococcota bacterium]|nr:phosphomannomutase/phosphoglucomutase [Myxococcota bacterium]MDW8362172.1 phosphomannomutase/phosphoglucomutase [Myxococcales bacterium]